MGVPAYNTLSRIDDNSTLSMIFNQVLGKLNMARIVSAPRTFDKMEKDIQQYTVYTFYNTCLWEMYLHDVISRLKEWGDILNEYFIEFDGRWKYYAASKRIEGINEYGGEDKDYDNDGNIRKANISDKELEYYTVVWDLVQDDWLDIVQETKPEDLNGLCAVLMADASVSITDVIKDVTGVEIPLYKQDENGNLSEMTFAERVLSKAAGECQASDFSNVILFVCHSIQILINKIKSLDKFTDNKKELRSIHKDIGALLKGDFGSMDILKEFYK